MIRKLLFILPAVFLSAVADIAAQSVAINTDGSTAAASAILDVKSTAKGVLVPRMSKTQKNAIASPATGLLIFQDAPDSIGFYYYSSGAWSWLSKATVNNNWALSGNTGTSVTTDYIGTTDLEDIAFKTNGTEAMRIDSIGKVGIGTTTPAHKLHVQGDIRFQGDFINQDALGTHSGAVLNIPFTNGVFNALNGTVNSITITDGSGPNNSAVFLSGFARVFGGNLAGGNTSLGGYFLILQRATDAAFTTPVNLTYTSGMCYVETADGATSHPLGFGGGGHVSFLDANLAPGTYYYRLVLYPNGINITSGTYDVYERDLVLLQIKR
jgi:hypothetical protein